MKIAIVGSRNVSYVILEKYISKQTLTEISEIVTGGAKGIDTLALQFAKNNHIPYKLFLPEYSKYKKGAPLKRNELIAEYADEAFIFWDGKSKGTNHVIGCFSKLNKKINLFMI